MLTMTHSGTMECRHALLYPNGSYERGNCGRDIDSILREKSLANDPELRPCWHAWTAPWGAGDFITADPASPCNKRLAAKIAKLTAYVRDGEAAYEPPSPEAPPVPGSQLTFWERHGTKVMIGAALGAVAVGGVVYARTR